MTGCIKIEMPDLALQMQCATCNHFSVSKSCPYCRRTRRCNPCDDPDCDFCQTNTLATSERALKRWHSTNNTQPRKVWRTSCKRVWLQCENCTRVYAQPASRVDLHDCALCANKTEKKLYDALRAVDANVAYQAQFDWSRQYRYDFFIRPNILIELDGPQHFVPVRSWKSGFDVCDTDVKKEELATQHGFFVIRVLQDDVWNDVGDWKCFLDTSISKCGDSLPAAVFTPDRKQYASGIYRRLRSAVFF